MKLPVNHVDVRMEQLLQRIRTSYEMAKDEELRLMIIESLHSVTLAIANSIKEANLPKQIVSKSLRKRIAVQSGGSLSPEDSKYPPDVGWCE